MKITAATAKRKGRTVTLTLRGTATGTGTVKVTALKHSAKGKIAGGAWKATLKLKTAAKKLTLTVSLPGARSVKKTVSVR